jgi:predicted Zn-dependent protease
MTCRVIARVRGRTRTGFEGAGTTGVTDLFDELPPERVGRAAAEQALRMLDAGPVKSGPTCAGGGLLLPSQAGRWWRLSGVM